MAQSSAWPSGSPRGRWYNTERPHRALAGCTPLAARNEDEAPVHRLDAAVLRHLLLAGVGRVGKDGVNNHGLAYVAPELAGRGGQSVEVRHMPHDDRSTRSSSTGGTCVPRIPPGSSPPSRPGRFLSTPARRRNGSARNAAGRRAANAANSRRCPATAPRPPVSAWSSKATAEASRGPPRTRC
ncbi:Mu transposase C-terminal domain-containing protein [Embleya sp. NPDC050493]|uniref:Mu transposase C-terminal domain-containing protein n=1 Tax=Embleya sp. NPDC050493 TaxID=3363989 RepID=UPI0037B4FF36